jgi:hypothetical protein
MVHPFSPQIEIQVEARDVTRRSVAPQFENIAAKLNPRSREPQSLVEIRHSQP